VVANWGRGTERRNAFAERFGSRPLDSIDAVCADPEVDLVVVSLPNHLHLEAVRSAAAHGKGVACTKPLGRNGAEAAEMVRAVREAGVFAAYLENVVFNAEMIRMREMVESGAIGRLTTFRAREGHSGPHAAHFWDADLAGGGALLDMASHGVEAARAMFGKDVAIREAFAWGDTLVHGDRTRLEDNAVLIVRFEDGRAATMDVSWSSKGGLESRFEAYGEAGRIVQDIISSPLRAFIERPAGYLGEKVDADTGWVFPVPDEARVYGYQEEMRHFVDCVARGEMPRETYADGVAVNQVVDACYRSMQSKRWEPVQL
jgi:predicted dehydrogenase